MLRTLRAFAWMRWRVLLNSLERTGARDSLERFSLAVEQIGPIIALLLVVPSAVGLAALGGYAGYSLATGEPAMTFETLRFALLASSGFAIVGPLLLPSMAPTAIVRLLLLPIPRGTLYAAQSAGAVSEPWVLISLPIVLSIPVGLAVGDAWLAAVVSLVAGLLLIVCIVGLATLSTLVLHLVVRDRRRGELLALLFIVLIPAIGLMPAALIRTTEDNGGSEHGRQDTASMPTWVTETAEVAYAIVPSELFTRATRSSAHDEAGDAVAPVLALVASGVLLHALGLLTFIRLLNSPSVGARRSSTRATAPGRIWLPLVSRASAAVAHAQLRLALRTPRGRSMVLSPLIVFALVAIVMYRQGEMQLGAISLSSGLSLATFGSAVCLLSLQPFAMNQFAIDRSGLTMALLSPLGTNELLSGKAFGIGLIAGGPAVTCIVVAFLLIPGGALSLWSSLPLAVIATYLLFAPGAAALSAIFPRTVDLNSIGRGSNPHSIASLLGLVVLVAAALPAIAIVALTRLVDRLALAPLAMLVWCAIALVVSRVLFAGVAVVFDKRRENLGMVAA